MRFTTASILLAVALGLTSFSSSGEVVSPVTKPIGQILGVIWVYDFPNFQGDFRQVQGVLRDQLAPQSESSVVNELPQIEVPTYPQSMKVARRSQSSIQTGEQEPVTCEGATVTVGLSSDATAIQSTLGLLKRKGIACVFPYQGGFRIDAFIRNQSFSEKFKCKNNPLVMYYLPGPGCGPTNPNRADFEDATFAALEIAFREKAWNYKVVDVISVRSEIPILQDSPSSKTGG